MTSRKSKGPRTIRLNAGDYIIAVVPEVSSGPGWGNAPTWVYIGTNDGRLITECIQPEDRTDELNALHSVGFAMCNSLLRSVPFVRLNPKL